MTASERLPFLAQQIFNTPLALHPDRAEVAVAALAEHAGLSRVVRLRGDAAAGACGEEVASTSTRPYQVVDGVAVIPIHGIIVPRLGSLRPYWGMTGCDGIAEVLGRALIDTDVRAIAFDINSPGGFVGGVFDLADSIFALRGIKPMRAILADMACSAAYALASAADHISVPRTGWSGSVGVICMHVDWSKAMDNAGIKVRFVHYGAQKAEETRAEYEGMSKDVLGRMQTNVDAMGDLFVETVARNRKLSAAAVRKTQAAAYLGEAGLGVGFVDSVASPDAAFRGLIAAL